MDMARLINHQWMFFFFTFDNKIVIISKSILYEDVSIINVDNVII